MPNTTLLSIWYNYLPDLPLPDSWWPWMAEQMSSYSLISRQTVDCRGSTSGLHFFKLLQFTRATSIESSQHRFAVLHQKSWLGKGKSSDVWISSTVSDWELSTCWHSESDVCCDCAVAWADTVSSLKSNWLLIAPFCLLSVSAGARKTSSNPEALRPPQGDEGTGVTSSTMSKSLEGDCRCPGRGKASVHGPFSGPTAETSSSNPGASLLTSSIAKASLWHPFTILSAAVGASCSAWLRSVLGIVSASGSSDRWRLRAGSLRSSFLGANELFLLHPIGWSTGTNLAKTSSKDWLTKGKRHCMEGITA